MSRPFPPVILAHTRLCTGAGLLLLAVLLTLTACQPIVALPVTAVPTIAAATPAPMATPSAFTYGVTVLDANGQPIANARVIIEIALAPLENAVDEHGYARIEVPASHAEKAGRIRVYADGFEPFTQEINLYPDRLPNEVRLIAQVVGNTAGFCPDNLTFATGFEGAKEDETLVVVSNFADTLGNDPRNLTFDLVERMAKTLAPHGKIRVERLNCAIKQQDGSETAMRMGSRKDVDASIVIWGVYVEPPDPEVRIYINVMQKETNKSGSFDHNFGPQAIQPTMFDFKASLGQQTGAVVAFMAGATLFTKGQFQDAETLFATASQDMTGSLASDFIQDFHFFRGTNYSYMGRFREAEFELLAILSNEPVANFENEDFYLPLLNNIGYVYFALGEHQKALEHFDQALPKYRQRGNKSGEARILGQIGQVYSILGEQQKALDNLNQALALNQEINNKKGEAVILNNISNVYEALGETTKALEYLNRALPLHQQVGNKAEEAATLNNIGVIYRALGEPQIALAHYEQGLQLIRQVGDIAGEATTLSGIGLAYYDLGDLEKALDYFNQALPLHLKAGDVIGEATTLNSLGGVYDVLGDDTKALDYYNQALMIFRRSEYKRGAAVSLNNIGSVFYTQGDTENALEHFSQALQLLQQIGDKANEASTLGSIGVIYHSLGEGKKALEYYNQSLLLYSQLSDKIREIPILTSIGVIYLELHENSKALDYFNQSLYLSRQIDNKAYEGINISNIGRTYAALGEEEKALTHFRDAIEILQQADASFYEVRVRKRLIEFLYAQSRLDEAVTEIEIAIPLATKLNHPDLPELQTLLTKINAQRRE